MRKSSIGKNAPLAEGPHFSDRSDIRPGSLEGAGNRIGTAEYVTGKGTTVPGPEFGAEPADHKNNAGPGAISGLGTHEKTAHIDHRKSYSTTQRRNRRPGRPCSQDPLNIEYPPQPNRRRKGLLNSRAGIETEKPGTGVPNNARRFPKKYQTVKSEPLYAALDLGTNNCRLLVALPQQPGKFRVVDSFSRIVRLGRGLENSGRLEQSAMDRSIDALLQCARKLGNHNIKRTRLIATEACRRAENGDLFLQRVKNETGLELEIIDRKTEAQLAAEGCGALVDHKAEGAVLFDIGGGSSELILLDRRGKKKKEIHEQISSWTSLPVGVVTLSERHGGRDISRKMFDAMIEEVNGHIAKFEGRNVLNAFWESGRVHLLGTSGTVTTLAGVHLKLPRYDRRQVDGIWLNDKQIDSVIDQLVEMDFDERAANPCIGHERADLVLAGCAILQAIRMTWPSPRLRVADRGLREGILTQLMNQDGVWKKPQNNGKHQSNWRKKGRKTND